MPISPLPAPLSPPDSPPRSPSPSSSDDCPDAIFTSPARSCVLPSVTMHAPLCSLPVSPHVPLCHYSHPNPSVSHTHASTSLLVSLITSCILGKFPRTCMTHHARVRPSVRFFVSFLCASVSPHSTPLSRTHPRPYMTFLTHLTVYFDTLHVLYILDCCPSTVCMCRILLVRVIFMY